MRPRVKICCIADAGEAKMAIDFGASAIGLVGSMPSGPGPIPDERIREIALSVPPPIATFLLTSQTTPEGIIEHHRRVGTNTIQIVDGLTEGTYDDIRQVLPYVRLVQVVHVLGEHSIDEAIQASESVDAILLDSGNPFAPIKELGGTGRVHDWNLSRRIRDAVDKPVFLAGGLNPDNVRRAIETVQPFAVDVCSGVRTNGKLDPVKLQKFFEAVM